MAKQEDHGEALAHHLDAAIVHLRALAGDREIPGNSVITQHKLLVQVMQLRRTVEGHNVHRANARAGLAVNTDNTAIPAAKVAPAKAALTEALQHAAGSGAVVNASSGVPPIQPLPVVPPPPAADPAFAAAVEELRNRPK